MAVCRRCGAPIIWVRTQEHDRQMPVNPGVDPVQGNLAVRRDGGRLVSCRVITDTAPLLPGEQPYLAHWATCTKQRTKQTKPRVPDSPALF